MRMKGFFHLWQHEHETIDHYLDRFREDVQTLDFAGINIFDHDGLIKLEATATADQKTKAKETAAEAFKAVCLLEYADPRFLLRIYD